MWGVIRPDGGVAVGGDPDAGKVVVIDAVFQKLSTSILMDIDTSGESVVDVAFHNGRIGPGLHLEACNPVVVDVVVVKVTLIHKCTTPPTARLSNIPTGNFRNFLRLWRFINHLLTYLLSSSSSSRREAFSRSIPPLRFVAKTSGLLPAAEHRSLVIPVSQQIWWIQVMGGRPRARFQSGDGRAPSWASQQVRRIWFAYLLSRV